MFPFSVKTSQNSGNSGKGLLLSYSPFSCHTTSHGLPNQVTRIQRKKMARKQQARNSHFGTEAILTEISCFAHANKESNNSQPVPSM